MGTPAWWDVAAWLTRDIDELRHYLHALPEYRQALTRASTGILLNGAT